MDQGLRAVMGFRSPDIDVFVRIPIDVGGARGTGGRTVGGSRQEDYRLGH
jgi:hypothetical protein